MLVFLIREERELLAVRMMLISSLSLISLSISTSTSTMSSQYNSYSYGTRRNAAALGIILLHMYAV